MNKKRLIRLLEIAVLPLIISCGGEKSSSVFSSDANSSLSSAESSRRTGENSSTSASSGQTSSIQSDSLSSSANSSDSQGKVMHQKIGDGVYYSGYLKDGKPQGDGVLEYADGTQLKAVFSDGKASEGEVAYKNGAIFKGKIEILEGYQFERVEGKYTESLRLYYEGKFVNDLYEDVDGKLCTHTFNKYGEIEEYGTLYEGAFVSGSSDGQKGTYYMPPFFTETYGVWFYSDCLMKNGVPDDKQTVAIEMKFGDGTFYEGKVTKGSTDFHNGCTYVGDYVNGVYQGYGVFTWDLPDGKTQYIGAFRNGSPCGQYGTKYFNCHFKGTEGVHYFYGKMDEKTFEVHAKDQTGKGYIQFADKSIFKGDLYYDPSGNYIRKGQGTMDFSACPFFAQELGCRANEKVFAYSGSFDATISPWIYGNGVMYYSGEDGRPSSYISGFYYGIRRIDEYRGNLDKNKDILPDWRETSEEEYQPFESTVEEYLNRYSGKTSTDTLFLGDSYMHFWWKKLNYAGANDFESMMSEHDCMNIGIGGTTFGEWATSFLKRLTKSLTSISHIVIHLGGNDSHMGFPQEEEVAMMKKMIGLVKSTFPSAHLYLLSEEPHPATVKYWANDKAVNAIAKAYIEAIDNATYVDTASIFYTGDDANPCDEKYFASDRVHLNELGYGLWGAFLKKAIYGE